MCINLFVFLVFMSVTAAAGTVVDFGRVEQGERPERAFEVQNESERAWRVRDVIRTCSCADLEVAAREVAPGVLISLVAWMTVSAAFSYYVEYVAQYTKLYGSITTVVVTLLWLYMSGTVLIMGAELNAVLRQRRQHRQ